MTDTDEKQRPSLGDYVRPSRKAPPVRGDAAVVRSAPTTDTPSATAATATPTSTSTQGSEEDPPPKEFMGEETPEEKEARDKMHLYNGFMRDLEPVVDYQAFLKREGISEEDAADIVDSLIMRGYYEERIPLTKRSTIVFRTRSQEDVIRLQTAMEVQRPVYESAVNELVVRYNMASSLAAVREQEFAFPEEGTPKEKVEAMFDVRLRYVEKLASALFSKISMKLAKFDRKIAAVMREGVAENF